MEILGSCTANSLAFIYEYDELKQNVESEFTPSRLFIYYNDMIMYSYTNIIYEYTNDIILY